MTLVNVRFIFQLIPETFYRKSSESSSTEYITIVIDLKNFQCVLNHCANQFEPVSGIGEEPQPGDLKVIFIAKSRSLIYN